MQPLNQLLTDRLSERIQSGTLRSLKTEKPAIDFTSNDYLGLSRAEGLRAVIESEMRQYPQQTLGSTGSRLLSGNSGYAEALEHSLGKFWNQEALLFNSGYDATLGFLSSVPKKTDTLILDQLMHACSVDGARLSGARREIFDHNDLDSLEKKLKGATGTIFVMVESMYSMDGDLAPLDEIAQLCQQFQANLVVDEAHTTGLYGQAGRGRVAELNLESMVFARIFTFGKALGSHGAAIAGSLVLKNYLINFARTFIYTTALPFHSLACIRCAWQYIYDHPGLTNTLKAKITLFRSIFEEAGDTAELSPGAIQVWKVSGNQEVKSRAAQLVDHGYDIRPIVYPSVGAGQERLRICIHAFNEDQDIIELANLMLKLKRLSH